MRVVADTNTVLSAFLWGGLPKAVLDAAREERISLHASPALLAEFEDVLSRDKFARRISQAGSTAAEMLTEYRALVTVTLPAPIAPTSRDPDDDHVLACALAAKAQLRGGPAFSDRAISGYLPGQDDRRRVFHETTTT